MKNYYQAYTNMQKIGTPGNNMVFLFGFRKPEEDLNKNSLTEDYEEPLYIRIRDFLEQQTENFLDTFIRRYKVVQYRPSEESKRDVNRSPIAIAHPRIYIDDDEYTAKRNTEKRIAIGVTVFVGILLSLTSLNLFLSYYGTWWYQLSFPYQLVTGSVIFSSIFAASMAIGARTICFICHLCILFRKYIPKSLLIFCLFI